VDALVTAGARAAVPVTRIEVSPPLPESWLAAMRSLVIRFQMIDGGRLTRAARTELNTPDFDPPGGVPIEGTVEPFPGPEPGELLLQDARDRGVLAGGRVEINANGDGKITLHPGVPPFSSAMRTPVTVFGNLIRATRGESVFNEVLGSGDASQAFQSFTLGNGPLTYLNDPAAPGGRRTTLEVRVNGITWKEVSSFFGAGPEDEVYVARQDDEGETVVTFGDGTTGARVPTGVDNITAAYRFGAGAAKPPAGGISQLARPVAGLRRVLNPVAAGGGADADRPQDIRRNAPSSALILGRAVSVQDFEALAREFGGVINAHAEWAWDETCQGAVVKVWFISDGGDIQKDLAAFLIGQADPNTPLVAEEAEAAVSELIIDLDVAPRFNPATVAEQVRQALTDPETGILALEKIAIGRPLFRSRLFDVILEVEGARSVRAMTVNGRPAPFAIPVAQGRYHQFLDRLVIGNTAAGDRLLTARDEGGAGVERFGSGG
jgi:predicted phage baseplate assembly protein